MLKDSFHAGVKYTPIYSSLNVKAPIQDLLPLRSGVILVFKPKTQSDQMYSIRRGGISGFEAYKKQFGINYRCKSTPDGVYYLADSERTKFSEKWSSNSKIEDYSILNLRPMWLKEANPYGGYGVSPEDRREVYAKRKKCSLHLMIPAIYAGIVLIDNTGDNLFTSTIRSENITAKGEHVIDVAGINVFTRIKE